jgi:Holliday junction resolvase RusA-like endonuclease
MPAALAAQVLSRVPTRDRRRAGNAAPTRGHDRQIRWAGAGVAGRLPAAAHAPADGLAKGAGVISFFLPGVARTKGSFRFIFRSHGKPLPRPKVLHDTDKSRRWQTTVKAAARAAHSGPPLDGPVEISLYFVMARPRSHWTKSGRLTSRAPLFPGHNHGDWDKLGRNISDALEGVCYVDDCQIVWAAVGRRFHVFDPITKAMETPGVHIRVVPADLRALLFPHGGGEQLSMETA